MGVFILHWDGAVLFVNKGLGIRKKAPGQIELGWDEMGTGWEWERHG